MVKANRKTRKLRTRNEPTRNEPTRNEPETVWGKDPHLEKFWRELASGKKVVVVYKDKPHSFVNLPKSTTKKYQTVLNEFEDDPTVVAILSSNQSQDAYEQYLYPKAKGKSVKSILQTYTRYFKPISPGEKLRVPF